jgi:uncharacterized membrane protein
MRWFRKRQPDTPQVVKKNITSIARLEQEFIRQRTTLDRISDAISRFSGSIYFVIAHAVLFGVWIVVNTTGILGPYTFDPYPFIFLNSVLAVEAVLLCTFVLMSQNRQSRQSDQWAHINLQIGLLAEQESTKMLQLLPKICERLDLHDVAQDQDLKEMIRKTHVEELAEELEKTRVVDEPGLAQ